MNKLIKIQNVWASRTSVKFIVTLFLISTFIAAPTAQLFASDHPDLKAYFAEQNPELYSSRDLIEFESSADFPTTDAQLALDPTYIKIQFKNGTKYELKDAPYTKSNAERFSELTPPAKYKFLSWRAKKLKTLARFLNKSRYALYLGNGTINKINNGVQMVVTPIINLFKKKKLADESTVADINSEPLLTDEATLTPEDVNACKSDSLCKKIDQESQVLVQRIIYLVDRELWRKAKLVTVHNEYYALGSIGVLGITGAGYKVRGGARSIGFFVTIDKNDKVYALSLYLESEKTLKAITPMFMIGILVKAGGGLSKNLSQKELLKLKGKAFYPPGAPGYAHELEDSVGDDMAGVGLNPSLFTTYPTFADAYSYVNEVTLSPNIRISFSPNQAGFIRIKFRTPTCGELLSNNEENKSTRDTDKSDLN
jgi:hypothetical protein